MQYETVQARHLTQAEVMALVTGEVDEIFGYTRETSHQHGATLTPVTFTRIGKPFNPDAINGNGSRRGVRPVYPQKPRGRNLPEEMVDDTSQPPVGYHVEMNVASVFGTDGSVYYPVGGGHDTCQAFSCREGRDGRFFVADESGEALNLMPIYGAQVTLSMIIKGIGNDEAQARAVAALEAEFGNGMKMSKDLSRPVKDFRVNVYDFDDKPIAVNVLEAEISQHMRGHGAVTTTEVSPDMVVGS